MLEGLDRIDWSSLEHAYGPAKDVPGLIRGLASDDAATRKWARRTLWSNVIHQGTVYSATSHAVPFLIELLGLPTVEDKPGLLVYVARSPVEAPTTMSTDPYSKRSGSSKTR